MRPLPRRPRLRRRTAGAHDERDGISHLLAHGGRPFDFHFDPSENRSLFCVERVSHALPDLALDVTSIDGRPTLTPDSRIRTALAHPSRLEVAVAVSTTTEGPPRRRTIDEPRADTALRDDGGSGGQPR